MQKQATKNGSALLIHVALALTIVGLGISLVGNVIPNHRSSEDLIQETVAKSLEDADVNQLTISDQLSEIAGQLKHAINAANQSDSSETEAPFEKRVVYNEKSTETNQLHEE